MATKAKDVIKIGESKGYTLNSNGASMSNGSGGKITISETGGNALVNGTKYTNTSDIRKSTKF